MCTSVNRCCKCCTNYSKILTPVFCLLLGERIWIHSKMTDSFILNLFYFLLHDCTQELDLSAVNCDSKRFPEWLHPTEDAVKAQFRLCIAAICQLQKEL